ncbi:hypothetical protein AXA44_15440 [Rhodococcus sp. SC4]|nr:hypothetical protein AXA44_15440 [Rhodococcus sp. SC4]
MYDGDDFADYVIDCNVTRRNMSTGARAMATALVLVLVADAGTADGSAAASIILIPRLADRFQD